MTTTPTPPTPITDPITLRHATLNTITANPAHWEQDAWRCGTGMCFAGWAAQLAGGTFPYPADDYRNFSAYDDMIPSTRASIVLSPAGDTETIDQFAQAALGLTTAQADVLFNSGNTLADLTELVRLLDGGESILDYHEPADEDPDLHDHALDYSAGDHGSL